ncbi:MAG: response regulator [Planctomyces sp.]|nr:response regulator [Planctomyces sp.]
MAPSQTLEVLVVEDDPDARENLRDVLELDGHRVEFASTAAEALAAARPERTEVVLLDWKLPDATALETLPRLKAAAPDADVVIVTGHGDFDRAVTALREGAADYLLKPIAAEALRSSLGRLAQRRWLAQEKSRSDAMFRNLVLAAPCLIMILRRDLTIAYFSPFAERLTGHAADECVGRNVAELLPDGVPEDLADAAAQLPADLNSTRSVQAPIRCRDGSIRWTIWKLQPIPDFDEAPALLAVGQDITEQKRATEQLVQSERLAAIGEAMTGLAHESRNALQRSQAFLELLASQLQGQSDSLRLVGRIQEAQHHLHQLYEEVRQYAAPLRVAPRPCGVRDVIDETWALLEHARSGRDAELVCSRAAAAAEGLMDRFMMQQVFRNILENSLAACGDPVRINVDCQSVLEGDRSCLEIAIRDNGPGLSAEQRQRIFDPFYTTKTRGTGLGMTLCRRIVDAHGGAIGVGPDQGGGTEILIRLPADPEF